MAYQLTIVSFRTTCRPFSASGLKTTCPPPKRGCEINLWTMSGSSSFAGFPDGFIKFNIAGVWNISRNRQARLIAFTEERLVDKNRGIASVTCFTCLASSAYMILHVFPRLQSSGNMFSCAWLYRVKVQIFSFLMTCLVDKIRF